MVPDAASVPRPGYHPPMVNGEPMADGITADGEGRARLRAVVISLAVSVVLLAAKYQAYRLTGSTAILSDALESIVNVVAAVFAIGALLFAGRPIVLGAGLVNLALGYYLIRAGRRYDSLTLIADGRHVLADFYTSAGIVVGLLLVRITGLAVLDPVVAAVVALNLMWTGVRLIRQAAAGLLDEEDPALLDRLLGVLGPHLGQGVIRVHHLRAIRSGRFHHVDAHLVVPEFWSVERSHELAEELGERVMKDLGVEGEMTLHTDPCHRIYCRMCDLDHARGVRGRGGPDHARHERELHRGQHRRRLRRGPYPAARPQHRVRRGHDHRRGGQARRRRPRHLHDPRKVGPSPRPSPQRGEGDLEIPLPSGERVG